MIIHKLLQALHIQKKCSPLFCQRELQPLLDVSDAHGV
jgi:hypothetical protein